MPIADQIVAEVTAALQRKGWVLPVTNEQYTTFVRDSILALIASPSRPLNFTRLAKEFGAGD